MRKPYLLDQTVIKQKFKAFSLHLMCSVLCFVLIVWLSITLLYPSLYFELAGGIYGVVLMASVDLVLGPLLTLLVYHPAKSIREKILDFSVIGVVQIAALTYGLFTLYEEHPKILMYHTHGQAVLITQNNWQTHSDNLPANLSQFSTVHRLPIVVYKLKFENETAHIEYVALNATDLAYGNVDNRNKMQHIEDKAYLAKLDKQYGTVYIMLIVGKYQSVYAAFDQNMQFIDTFGQRNLE